ncbi:hypothetical protein [Alkalimonas amylolytica]|uniref:Uncharacterized protein n=1 Tax=Alkalimonas amylolytica TaxID=152573 RepID=A0A1H4EHG4_ALKAM|nr:hypothetical protein [Alkalimonas amylolytica]SEA84453.1 hypothetical protein SAMN04488051_10735 [Alkalimonas amylolytica]
MKVMNLAVGCLLSLFIGATQASTVVTKQNLQRYLTMLPEMEALEARFPEVDSSTLELQSHCNWQRHYDTTLSKLATTEHRRALEQLLKQHNFTPAEYTELSFKFAWTSLQMVEPMMEMMQQMLEYMPAEERAEQEAEMHNLKQITTLLNQCMTNAEKETITKLTGELMQQMMGMDEESMQQFEQLLQQMQ